MTVHHARHQFSHPGDWFGGWFEGLLVVLFLGVLALDAYALSTVT